MRRAIFVLAFLGVVATSLAPAVDFEITLHPVSFQERRRVEVTMLPTRRVEARMRARARYEEGQARIEISYNDMKPAVLFGGDVTCYVLWAVNRDGGVENLGELWVRPEKDDDNLVFSTGLRTFALLVTAEPYYQVSKPSELVVFWNDSRPDPAVQVQTLPFKGFAEAPKYGFESLRNVRYDGKTPLDLLQAEKALEIAERLGAPQYAAAVFQEATVGLRQAETAVRSSVARRGAQEFARKSVASSNEAIRITLRTLEAKALDERIAARRAEMAGLEAKAAEAEQRASEASKRAQETEASILSLRQEKAQAEAAVRASSRELEQIRGERDRVRAQQAELERAVGSLREERARLEREKELLQGRLQEALSLVADTRQSARGFILNLPDILFDVNQATLKPEAKLVIAKLAGILLIMRDLNLRIEGHTDSTGSASYNLRLSRRRSDAVFDFLAESGITTQRMNAVGYGMERPISENSTAEGRSQNRRVEIIIREGQVEEEAAG